MKNRKLLEEKLPLMCEELQTGFLDFLIYLSEVDDEADNKPIFDLISTTACILAEEREGNPATKEIEKAERKSDNEDNPVSSS